MLMSPQKGTHFQYSFNCKELQSNPFENICIHVSSKLNLYAIYIEFYSGATGFPIIKEKT